MIMWHVPKNKLSQLGFKNMIMNSVYSSGTFVVVEQECQISDRQVTTVAQKFTLPWIVLVGVANHFQTSAVLLEKYNGSPGKCACFIYIPQLSTIW